MYKYCLVCGKKFYKSKNCSLKVWNTTHKFCSIKCWYKYKIGKKQSKEQIDKKTKYPRFFICEICGKRIKNNKGLKLIRFCSQKCHGISQLGSNLGFKKGNIPWNKGLKGVQVAWNKGIKGKESHAYQGGKSFEPYGLEFNEDLKEVIRNRDRRKCQLCGKTELENEQKLDVHHIDYNKKNNDPINLVSLCRCCHSKTNTCRNYWIKYFDSLVNLRK